MKNKQNGVRKVGIVGCEHVGVTAVYSLARSSSIDRVMTLGDNAKHLSGQVNDLLDAMEFELPKVAPVEFAGMGTADIVIIAAAPTHRNNETVDERIKRNEAEVRRQVRSVMAAGFDGVFLVLSNPTDLMAAAAHAESGLSFRKVFGLAASENVEGVTWCTGMHSPNYIDNCDPTCPFFDKVLSNYHSSAHAGAKRALATCVTRVCEAIFNDEHSILPLAALSEFDCKAAGRFTTMQCILGRNGIERRLAGPIVPPEAVGMRPNSLQKPAGNVKSPKARPNLSRGIIR
jgi:malate/lactate dehydrogenase